MVTVTLVAVTLFGDHQQKSRCFLKAHGYIQRMPCKSNLNRRLHKVPQATWQALFGLLAEAHR